jgi:hypothetical protein
MTTATVFGLFAAVAAGLGLSPWCQPRGRSFICSAQASISSYVEKQ